MPIHKPLPARLVTPDIEDFLTKNGAKKKQIDGTGGHFLEEKEYRKNMNRASEPVPIKQNTRKGADTNPSPMSWQYTALGAPEALKESPYKLSRILGLSAHSATISIDGSSYRSSTPGQASHSLRAILAKNSHKSWATPPMRTPPL